MQVFANKRGTLPTLCMLGALTGSLLQTYPNLAQTLQPPITLPLEIMGPPGFQANVTVDLPQASARQVTSLWLQVHGLEYPDLASVRVNHGPWVPLNNQTVTVAQPGLGYGGIGGAFATLKVTLPLAPGSVVDGLNSIAFRFNRTNGVVSGFRVLAFNFLEQDGKRVLPPQAFIADDPEQWAPPMHEQKEIAEGARLWRSAPLRASSLPGAPAIRAHCGDCHARDGRDLKYFNYSNLSIIARSQFHGLSEQEGTEIASYIRALDAPHPGRPWNPPYQPGPGMQTRPGGTLAAGAGLDSVLDGDSQTLGILFGELDGSPTASPSVFAPDGHLKLREIPIAFQMPDWNHWLPQVHPLDAWGDKFARSELSRMYAALNTGTNRRSLDTDAPGFFARWLKSRSKFLQPPRMGDAARWSPGLAQSLYATLLWQLVKTWEISQLDGLEAAGGDVLWKNVMAAETAPAAINIPNNANGMAGIRVDERVFQQCLVPTADAVERWGPSTPRTRPGGLGLRGRP